MTNIELKHKLAIMYQGIFDSENPVIITILSKEIDTLIEAFHKSAAAEKAAHPLTKEDCDLYEKNTSIMMRSVQNNINEAINKYFKNENKPAKFKGILQAFKKPEPLQIFNKHNATTTPRKKISTLNIPEEQKMQQRRSGNSTRQADFAIQVILAGHICKVQDHFNAGYHTRANRDLYKKIVSRISEEHSWLWQEEDGLVVTETAEEITISIDIENFNVLNNLGLTMV